MAGQNDSKAFETVQNYVTEMYANHKVRPGDCIYGTSLAEELGLSRTPVRDALGRLVANGFLEQSPGKRGCRVPALEFDDMREAFEARESLEEKIGWLAAEKAQKSDIEILRFYNDQEIKFYDEGKKIEYIKANDLFHLSLSRIAKNRYIERSYSPVYWRTQLYVYYLGPFSKEEKVLFDMKDYNSDTPHEHAHIIEAVANRDPAAAAERCLEHIRATFTHRLSKQFSCPSDILCKLLKLN